MLVTGFQPFGNPKPPTNPSWEAIRILKNHVIPYPNPSNPDIILYLVKLDVLELPVEYEAITNIIPAKYGLTPSSSQANPQQTRLSSGEIINNPPYDFYIHIGQGRPDIVTFEGMARRYGYEKPDNQNRVAPGHQCPDLGFDIALPEKLYTNVGSHTLLHYIMYCDGLKGIRLSDDAGLYLCEFTYYVSLACSQFVAAAFRSSHSAKASTSSTRWTSTNTTTTSGRHPKKEPLVLFIHVPPESEDFPIERSQEIVFKVIQWVGAQVHVGDLLFDSDSD
ncbi:hypothetical protein IWQ61_006969 [Dispira simplex]|nr:hypothetical protein IWQ61_006969 [Dispira simplex]